jgi:hypothetical protein
VLVYRSTSGSFTDMLGLAEGDRMLAMWMKIDSMAMELGEFTFRMGDVFLDALNVRLRVRESKMKLSLRRESLT